MLLGKQGGRHEHGDLLAGLHGDKGCPHRHLGFTEAHVAADDTIHRLLGIEIGDHLADGLGLISGFLERERIRESLIFQIFRS